MMDTDRDPWFFQRWAFRTKTGSTPRKAVLNALGMMADTTTGRCEAKVCTIAAGCEMGERTVRTHLAALVDDGLIARRPQYRADGGRRGDEFLLLAPGVVEWPDGTPVPQRPGGGGGELPTPPAAAAGGDSPSDDPTPPAGAAAQELPLGGTASEPNDHPQGDTAPEADIVDRLIRLWIKVTPGREGARVTDNRRRIVKARLRSFSAQELARLIDEVPRHPFYNGQGDSAELLNDLTSTMRNDERVEKWLATRRNRLAAEAAGQPTPGMPSGQSQAARRRAADVDATLDALDAMIAQAEQNGGNL